MKLFRPWFFFRYLYPDAIIRLNTKEKVLCLTFDDGPDPGSTENIIAILEKFGIKGIFFCSGKAAEKYPQLVRLISAGGHVIGNHGYNHYDGWKTPTNDYSDDIKKGSMFINSRLFRPPYGHLKLRQYKLLVKEYIIFFWDLMPYDFDKSFSREKSLIVLKRLIRPGSVIVFHDTPTAFSVDTLSEFISHAVNTGYRFVLPDLKGI
jgi:peptidoglycan/xylan/chitin deacetylase (PgdA/CDA1 family)